MKMEEKRGAREEIRGGAAKTKGHLGGSNGNLMQWEFP